MTTEISGGELNFATNASYPPPLLVERSAPAVTGKKRRFVDRATQVSGIEKACAVRLKFADKSVRTRKVWIINRAAVERLCRVNRRKICRTRDANHMNPTGAIKRNASDCVLIVP